MAKIISLPFLFAMTVLTKLLLFVVTPKKSNHHWLLIIDLSLILVNFILVKVSHYFLSAITLFTCLRLDCLNMTLTKLTVILCDDVKLVTMSWGDCRVMQRMISKGHGLNFSYHNYRSIQTQWVPCSFESGIFYRIIMSLIWDQFSKDPREKLQKIFST